MDTFDELVKHVNRIVNNEKFKVFCNPHSITYAVSEADTERVLLAYGLLLNESINTGEKP